MLTAFLNRFPQFGIGQEQVFHFPYWNPPAAGEVWPSLIHRVPATAPSSHH